MLRRRLSIFALLAAAALPTTSADASALEPRTWEFRDGRWPEVVEPAPTATATQPAVDPVLLRVEELLQQRRPNAARQTVLRWLLKPQNKTSPQRDKALFLMARALYDYGDRFKAFYYLDELMDTYPESTLFYRALETQFQIAEAFLDGYKSRFLGVALFTHRDEGIEMLYRIQQRSPGSPLAERALLRTADWYYADAQYDLASDTYAAYMRSYPRSVVTDRVMLRQAFSNLAQFRGPRFDATPVLDARQQLVNLAERFPQTAEQESIPAVLERIDRTLAQKLFVTGDFYQRTHEPTSAAYLYELLVSTYPDAPEARQARARLERLGPAPIPATRPVVSSAQ